MKKYEYETIIEEMLADDNLDAIDNYDLSWMIDAEEADWSITPEEVERITRNW